MPRDYGCAATLLVLRRQIPHIFNRRTLGRFRPYRLLTLPKRKSRLICIFIVNYIYQAFFWCLVFWCLVKLACVRIFSRHPRCVLKSHKSWFSNWEQRCNFFNSERATVEVACACVPCKLFKVTAQCYLFSPIVRAVNLDYIGPEISTKIVCPCLWREIHIGSW